MLRRKHSSSMFQPKPSSLPQINIDMFNPAAVLDAIVKYGTYELVGDTMNEMVPQAIATIAEQTRALDLPLETLSKYDNRGEFNGFQNIKENTENQVMQGKAKVVRNSVALHYNPRKPDMVKIPEGISQEIFNQYYQAARNALIKHHHDIERAFVHESLWSNFNEENNTVLMMRRYYATYEPSKTAVGIDASQATTGIPTHSDHGEASLVTDDAAGLEVYYGKQWIAADHTPGRPRFMFNTGDALLFKLKYSHQLDPVRFPYHDFQAGLHRVAHVNQLRHSLTVSLNPADDALIPTPLAGFVTFSKFLKTPKSLYRDTSRDDSANNMGALVDQTRPKHPMPIATTLPPLYVVESGKKGQDSWVLINGADRALSHDDASLPENAKGCFSFAYTTIEDARHAAGNVEYLREFEVTPIYGNNIFVIDASSTQPAATIKPLNAYAGEFKNPVYLIQRQLIADEATEMVKPALAAKKW